MKTQSIAIVAAGIAVAALTAFAVASGNPYVESTFAAKASSQESCPESNGDRASTAG